MIDLIISSQCHVVPFIFYHIGQVGHVQDIEVEDGAVLKMKTLAVNPPIFGKK